MSPTAHTVNKPENAGKTTPAITAKQPRSIQRADAAPEHPYAMVVDGHFKSYFSEESAARKASAELLARYPMIQIEIYYAGAKMRTEVQSIAGKATH
jgi:hypothetical protein